MLGSEQQAEDQSTCAIDAQDGHCDEEQLLLAHQNTDSEGKSHLSLQSETSNCAGNENQQSTSYERVWGYERVHHCDIPLESLLRKSCTKPEDTCS